MQLEVRIPSILLSTSWQYPDHQWNPKSLEISRQNKSSNLHGTKSSQQKLTEATMRTLVLRPQYHCHQPPSCFLTSSNSFIHSFKPHRRFHFVKPCSSLKQTKKQNTLQKSTTNAPRSLGWFFNPKGDDDDNNNRIQGNGMDAESEGLEGDTAVKGSILAGVLLLVVVGGFGTMGYVYKDQINAFLTQFSGFIEGNFLKVLYPFLGFFLFIWFGFCLLVGKFSFFFPVILWETEVDFVENLR